MAKTVLQRKIGVDMTTFYSQQWRKPWNILEKCNEKVNRTKIGSLGFKSTGITIGEKKQVMGSSTVPNANYLAYQIGVSFSSKTILVEHLF